MIYLNSSDLQQICQYAEEIYPEECCGLLLGKITSAEKIVTQVWPTKNVWNQFEMQQIFGNNQGENLSRRNRFAIAPKAILEAQKYALEHKNTVMGIYHSHPDHPAIPSECDQAIAWEQYSYIIISVENGKVSNYRSWILDQDSRFEEEDIAIAPS